MFIHIQNHHLIHLKNYSQQTFQKSSFFLPKNYCGLFITAEDSVALTFNAQELIIPATSWRIFMNENDTVFKINGHLSIFVFAKNQDGISIDQNIFPQNYGPNFQGFTLSFEGHINTQTDIQLLTRWFQNNDDTNTELYRQELNYSFNLLLITLSKQFIRKIQQISNSPTSQSDSHFEKIERYITDHIHERLVISKIAQKFEITPEYLTSLFRKNEHITAIKYIHFLKISGAKDLLIRTTMSVKQVALYFGFTNIKYFYRLFKKETGITPSEYRQLFQDNIQSSNPSLHKLTIPISRISNPPVK
ncbi:AraC family transcriptional regulator [Levilactobacillus zymae]|uniref:helix-turn-helix transcriptional regulator n=1 Tax=Levilactobacillus zymae TaxID=267363 RepID=UPI0028BACA2B|nr:AraC family transcriptional regulator [Levilactobacillus zymae]MDT6979252.1 AraC family transcriptional regulator [Levilactobacillus zymae]